METGPSPTGKPVIPTNVVVPAGIVLSGVIAALAAWSQHGGPDWVGPVASALGTLFAAFSPGWRKHG